ncbi:MAG: DNA-directed RNA polymerase specialized sigma24 family protein [Candidatus Azotimanducaceae bacterium]|jgi:DNA-directed RNA polymerase specialized sigma24 family protein
MVLDLLPNEQRQAFYLRHELECSIAEIAEIQACNPEAAKSRLRYAYSKIKIQLEDEI